jgi:hypothetical protein
MNLHFLILKLTKIGLKIKIQKFNDHELKKKRKGSKVKYIL